MNTGKGVDRANRKLNMLEAKLDLVLEYFARAAPPEERELAALVQKRGGAEVVVRDDAALAELLLYNVGPDSDAEKGPARADDAEGLEVVERELAEARRGAAAGVRTARLRTRPRRRAPRPRARGPPPCLPARRGTGARSST